MAVFRLVGDGPRPSVRVCGPGWDRVVEFGSDRTLDTQRVAREQRIPMEAIEEAVRGLAGFGEVIEEEGIHHGEHRGHGERPGDGLTTESTEGTEGTENDVETAAGGTELEPVTASPPGSAPASLTPTLSQAGEGERATGEAHSAGSGQAPVRRARRRR